VKKTIGLAVILLSLVLFYSFAFGETPPLLPESAVKPFQSARWEGYQLTSVSGFNYENAPAGQYAVIMKKCDHNVLCIVENAQGQAEYAITMENDKAIYQGELLPNLLFDSGGDTLFYTYQRQDGDISVEYYHSNRIDGLWSPVDITLYFQPVGHRRAELLMFTDGGDLRQQVLWTDGNGNIVNQDIGFTVGMEDGVLYDLRYFDIERNMAAYRRWKLNNTWGGLFYEAVPELPRAVRSVLPGDLRFLYGLAKENVIFIMLEAEDGARQLLVFDRIQNKYVLTAQSAKLGLWRGTVANIVSSSSSQELRLGYDEGKALFTFGRTPKNTWTLRTVQAYQEVFNFNSVGFFSGYPECYLYGSVTDMDLSTLDTAILPATLAEALFLVDTDGWAVVKSDKPTDRLHLRTAPSTGAESIGRYYSGTPVQILEDQSEWTWVSVGGIEGYMAKKFLAYGQDMLHIPRWFPGKILIEADAEQGVNVYSSPNTNAGVTGTIRAGDEHGCEYIIATVGDYWYHVMCDDGFSGYVEARHFWDGNG